MINVRCLGTPSANDRLTYYLNAGSGQMLLYPCILSDPAGDWSYHFAGLCMSHPQSLMVDPDRLGIARNLPWVIPRAARYGARQLFVEEAQLRLAARDCIDEGTCFSSHRYRGRTNIPKYLLTNRPNKQDAYHHTKRHSRGEPRHLNG